MDDALWRLLHIRDWLCSRMYTLKELRPEQRACTAAQERAAASGGHSEDFMSRTT